MRDFASWRAEAAAMLSQWHGISPTAISDQFWRRFYDRGDNAWQAADSAANAVSGRCRDDSCG
jgi:hypothetical protein